MAANDSLTVLGDAFVAVTNFNNYGTVATDSLKITAENFDANIYNTGTISADSLNFILADTFTHKVNSFNGFSFNNLGVNTRGDFTNRHELNVSTLTITVADFDANINNDSTISADSLNLITSGNFINNSDILENFTFNNLAITANNYTQGVAIDIAGDLSIQVTSEASLDDNASIKARNLFFSAYNLYNQADITITENATFEVWSDFGNGFYFDGTAYDGGDIIAVIAKLLKVKFSKISLLLIKLPLVIRFKLSAEIVESLLILASKSATVIVKVETLSSCLFVKSPLVLTPKLLKENPLKELTL